MKFQIRDPRIAISSNLARRLWAALKNMNINAVRPDRLCVCSSILPTSPFAIAFLLPRLSGIILTPTCHSLHLKPYILDLGAAANYMTVDRPIRLRLS
jgi:hypothetical protein